MATENPRVILVKQTSLKVMDEPIDESSTQTRRVHVVIKNQPFTLQLASTSGFRLKDCESVRLRLWYADVDKQVDYISKEPVLFKKKGLKQSAPTELLLEVKIAVLSSQLEDSLFKIELLINDLSTGVVTEPYRVISKPEVLENMTKKGPKKAHPKKGKEKKAVKPKKENNSAPPHSSIQLPDLKPQEDTSPEHERAPTGQPFPPHYGAVSHQAPLQPTFAQPQANHNLTQPVSSHQQNQNPSVAHIEPILPAVFKLPTSAASTPNFFPSPSLMTLATIVADSPDNINKLSRKRKMDDSFEVPAPPPPPFPRPLSSHIHDEVKRKEKKLLLNSAFFFF